VSTPDPRPVGRPGTDPTLSPLGTDRPSTPAPTAGPVTSPPAATPPSARTARHTGRTIGRTLGLVLLLFVTVLFVVFNTQTVAISLVFTDVEAPLVLALLIAAGLGGLVVGLLAALRSARGRRSNR
jgi:uncharacterized integral membrane protein